MAISDWTGVTSVNGRELLKHGSIEFPAACYLDDLQRLPVPLHWHDEFEAAFVVEGSASFRIGDRVQRLCAGEGYFVNSGVLHAADIVGGLCRSHSVVFNPCLLAGAESVIWRKYIQPFIADSSMDGICLTHQVSWQGEILCLIENVWNTCREEGYGYEYRMREALSDMMLKLIEYRNTLDHLISPRSIRESHRIKQMLSFIHMHYAETLTIADIAGAAAVSASECLRCFRNAAGTMPIQYVKRFRLQTAAELLHTTDRKISDIAAACGFDDASYFAHEFFDFCGMKPNEYRKSMT